MAQYDATTFAAKQTVKVPAEAVSAPISINVNRAGQILFAPLITVPLSDAEIANPHKVWFWNGKSASTFDQGVQHSSETTGSNQAINETAPSPFLSDDGSHLLWFAQQSRRLQRDNVDLSISSTWQVWQTDLTGNGRQDIASVKLPDCRCTTGNCEESCPTPSIWIPESGAGNFFFVTLYVAGQTSISYTSTILYEFANGKWTSHPLTDPLQRILDAASLGSIVVAAIPDAGCCGWSNESDDQTFILVDRKSHTVFDERATYKNPDYDVSFFTQTARLSPDQALVAMTITATTLGDKAIQLADEGQANLDEFKQIRKSLAELPAVAIKANDDAAKPVAFLPHCTLVGWINDKEILAVEDKLLVTFNLTTGAKKKSTIRVEDAAHVFLR